MKSTTMTLAPTAARPEAQISPGELSYAECEEVLRCQGLGRVGCYSPQADESYVVPVAYVYHPGAIYLALVPGQKLRYLTEHPHGVCFEVEESSGGNWQSVVVVGTFSRVEPAAQHPTQEPKRASLRTVFDIGLAPYPKGAQLLCKIEVHKLSGRRDVWAPEAEFRRLAETQ